MIPSKGAKAPLALSPVLIMDARARKPLLAKVEETKQERRQRRRSDASLSEYPRRRHVPGRPFQSNGEQRRQRRLWRLSHLCVGTRGRRPLLQKI